MGEFDVVVGQEAEPEGGGGCKTCGLSCLGILVLLLLVIGVMSANASARLDARFVEIGKEVQELQASADVRRGTVLGAPANDENGAVDYNGLEWVLTSGEGGSRRNSWEQARPPLPAGVDAMVKRVNPEDTEIDLILSSALLAEIDSDYGIKDTPQERARRKQAEAQFKRLRPVLRYVRDGLQRGKCDWETEWAKGMRFETPNLLAMRATANLMAYEASLQPPSEAIQTGLEIVAFGEDNARQGTLIGGMIGIAISQIGFQSLARTLERPGLELRDYQRVIEALSRYEPPKVEDLLRGERVTVTVSLLQLGGRSLDQTTPEEASSNLAGFGEAQTHLLGLDVTQARELEGYERFHERAGELVRLPVAERRQRLAEFQAEMEEEHYLLATQLFVSVDQCAQQLELSLGAARVLRALAAAHQVRLQRGAFPQSVQALAGALGEGFNDPTSDTGGPLGYALHPPYVRCWVAGSNGVDDGGPRLQLPSPPWTQRQKGGKKKRTKKKRTQAPAIGGAGDDFGFQSMAPPPAPPTPGPR